jgi:hypothetical protein
LLSLLFHLGVAAVAVAILAAIPLMYLAWEVLPATAKEPVWGRLAQKWDPVELGVHRVVGGGPMPTYVRRQHDKLLAAVLDPAVRGSRLVVLRGGSSTGKSRAAYQAVMARLADWRLDYPQDPASLAARLKAGIPARTVLWLGDLRDYADLDGGPATLACLADLLNGEGQIVITAVWPEHWDKYKEAARAWRGAADPAGVTGRLLERLPELTVDGFSEIDPVRGGVIDVAPRFTGDDLHAAARTGDQVLAQAAKAAAAAGHRGQVTQYLAGVPALLKRYAGDGGDPYGQAVITAAMDAARLGHASPLPATFLQDAAVGYLTDEQRTQPLTAWGESALRWASEKLDGAVRALQPTAPATGTGLAGYQIADYLDQHGRRIRRDQLGPPALWDALAAHTTSRADLVRLGRTARERGLYRHAATLWTKGTALGSADAASQLIILLHQVTPEDTATVANWAGQANLDDPEDIATLLEEMQNAGADSAVQALADRATARTDQATARIRVDRAPRLILNDPEGRLASTLREPEQQRASATLTQAISAQVTIMTWGPQVASLLRGSPTTGTGDAARVLIERAAQVNLDHSKEVVRLLAELYVAKADGVVEADAAALALADRAATRANVDHPMDVGMLLWQMHVAGADAAALALADRAATQASLDDPWRLATLLEQLRKAGADGAARTLANRAAHVQLDDPDEAAWLLREMRLARADDAIRTVLGRDPATHVSLEYPRGVAELLKELRTVGADDAIRTVLGRDPATHVSLTNPEGVARLEAELRLARAYSAARALANRAADAGMFEVFLHAYPDEADRYRFGREPDGTPAQPWRWNEPISPRNSPGNILPGAGDDAPSRLPTYE